MQIEYRIREGEDDNFVQALEEVRLIRLRDGAFRWDVLRDPAEPGRYVEAFEVVSWAEHLRQHERATVMDQAIEARARISEPVYRAGCRAPRFSTVDESC
jgi:quinol monooxygenase YgiN